MTNYVVASGQTSSGLTLNAGDNLVVMSGGTLVNLVVNSGATDTVQSGGNVSQVLVEGSQTLAGGTATSETVVSGGVESVLSGGHVYSAGVWSGGTQAVFTGGQADDLVSSGGLVTLSGGFAFVTLLGGEFDVDGGFGSSGFGVGTVSSGGLEVVSGSGAHTDDGVLSGGREIVIAGGSATVSEGPGGVLIVSGGVADGDDGGTVSVTDGQYLGNVDLSGTVIVSSGGIDGGGQIAGTVIILASGLATPEPNNNQGPDGINGHLIVSSGGSALNETISDGGTITVLSGGTVTGSHLAFDATMVVSSGGSASRTFLISAEAIVSSGGFVGNTQVEAGGLLLLMPGAVQSGTVSSGGQALSAGVTILHANAFVSSAASISNLQLGSSDLAVVLSGGALTDATVSGGGQILAGGGGVVSGATVNNGLLTLLGGGVADGLTVGSSGGLALSGGVASGVDLLAYATLDLGLLPFSAGETASYDSATNSLQLFGAASSPGAPLLFSQALSGSYAGDTFTVSGYLQDTATSIQLVPCFTPGTAILTDRGERPVETLAIGDRVITHRGQAEPIVWIGRRSYAGRFLLGQRQLQPVTIQAGALGGGLPRQDLVLSPMHALFIDGVLVPAGLLVDGSTITQPTRCERVDYLHIELAEHGVVFAQGAAAETFLDDDSRGMFQNAQDYAERYPDPAEPGRACAARIEHGYALEAIRARLAAARPAAA